MHELRPPRTFPEKFLLCTGSALLLLGITVMVGWILASLTLVRLYPGGSPMVFNTALCFVVAALGYGGVGLRQSTLPKFCGGFLTLVGAITFAQFPAQRSFGIDEFLLTQRLAFDLSGPGRMAPNTAVLFVCCGLSLLSMSLPRRPARLIAGFGAIVFAVGLLSLGGYLTGLRSAFSWGRFTGMALPTTVAFVVISLAQMSWAVEQIKKAGQPNAVSLPFFMTSGATILVLSGVFYVSTVNEKNAVDWVQHTSEVLEAFGAIETNVFAAQSNVRGFLLSQDRSFLAGFDEHQKIAFDQMERVATLTLDNPRQQARIDAARHALHRRFSFLVEATTPAVYQNSEEVARRSTEGRRLTEQLRTKLNEMKAEEVALRTERVQRSEESTRQLQGTIVFGSALVMALFSVAVVFTFKAEAKQAVAEANLLLINRDLETRVQQRTLALRQATLDAQAIAAQLSTVLSHSPIIFWSLDDRGTVKMVEGQALAELGIDRKNLIGRSFLQLIKDDPHQVACTERALRGETFSAEVTFRNRYFQNHYSPLRNAHGQMTGFVGLSIDITSRREAERLALAEQSARESSRLKSEFLANMSHEIRTPMNGVLGMTTLLMDTPLTDEQREMARVVQDSGHALLSIIDDILDFSKIEAGKLRIDPTLFNLRQLVDDTLALLAPRAHEKKLELLSDFDPHLPTGVRGDAGRIRQVLTNLVGNAIKFTTDGEVVVTTRQIAVSSDRVGFRIEIKDTGVGVPLEVQSNLFKPFEQGSTGTQRKFGGTGLGLAISRQLVELMVGSMGFESTPGQGSLFWFQLELPRVTEMEAATVPPFAEGGRVLIVDDNSTNRRILVRHLEKFGFAVDSAEGASSALAFLAKAAPQAYRLAVLDWHMPETDGVALARQIRRDPQFCSLPLILLSSSGGDGAEAKEVGALILTKPTGDTQLRQAIARLLSCHPAGAIKSERPSRIPRSREALQIILADDNQTNRLVGRLVLENMGHRVDLVDDGRQLIEKLQNATYDLVFTDCQMPEMDGYEVTRRIRRGEAGERNRGIPIVALTAYAMPEDRIKCLDAGMDDYVSKPLQINEVNQVLERVLQAGKYAAASFAEAEQASFDPAALQQFMVMGPDGLAFVQKLVGTFEGEREVRLTAMDRFIAEKSSTWLAREAHGLAGTCGVLGGREARVHALSIEKAATENQWVEIPHRFEQLKTSLLVLGAELTRFIAAAEATVFSTAVGPL